MPTNYCARPGCGLYRGVHGLKRKKRYTRPHVSNHDWACRENGCPAFIDEFDLAEIAQPKWTPKVAADQLPESWRSPTERDG